MDKNNTQINVTAVCCTAGRHSLLEQSVRMFLEQDYPSKRLLIFNNGPVAQRLDPELSARHPEVILVNQSHRRSDSLPYSNLGDVYTDAMDFVPVDTDVLTFWDDDDYFMPDHLSIGVAGLTSTGLSAYKPLRSMMYDTSGTVSGVSNTLEPSIFVHRYVIDRCGFSPVTGAQHMPWVNWLVQSGEMSVDSDGIPTLVYDWSGRDGVYKTSGDMGNPDNFENCRANSMDHGDGIISIAPEEKMDKYRAIVRKATEIRNQK